MRKLMYLAQIAVAVNIALALCGCATSPKPGEVVHARVVTVVGEWLYQKVSSEDQYERLNNPYRTQDIQDAINAGVSIDDVREGRLVICSCRYGSNSGMGFVVLLPRDVILPHGDRVELELEAGRPGNLSVFGRVLPERPQGRTDCFPEKGGITHSG